MSKSAWKIPFTLCSPQDVRENTNILINDRSSVISEAYVGHSVSIHTGRSYVTKLITFPMLHFKFGAFAPTRVRHIYKKKLKK